MKKIVKITALAALIGVGSNAFALNSGALKGLYGSIGAEYVNVPQTNDYSFVPSGTGYAPTQEVTKQTVGQGAIQLGVGYGRFWHQNYYTAAEFDYDVFVGDHTFEHTTAAKIKSSTVFLKDKSSLKDQMQLSAIFGRKFAKNILGYVKIGYSHLTTNDHIEFQKKGFETMPWVSDNYKINMDGVVLGLGARLPVSDHIQLAGEYDYTDYGTATYHHRLENVLYGGTIQTIDTTEKVKNVHSNKGVVSLIYTF